MTTKAQQLVPVTEGWTEPIVQRILNDGAPFGIQGCTVELLLYAADGTQISTSTKVDNLDDGTTPNKGKVRLRPGATDLVVLNSQYYWKWKITDAGGKVAFCPNELAARLRVFPIGK